MSLPLCGQRRPVTHCAGKTCLIKIAKLLRPYVPPRSPTRSSNRASLLQLLAAVRGTKRHPVAVQEDDAVGCIAFAAFELAGVEDFRYRQRRFVFNALIGSACRWNSGGLPSDCRTTAHAPFRVRRRPSPRDRPRTRRRLRQAARLSRAYPTRSAMIRP